MGFISFVKGLFEPSLEEMKKLKEGCDIEKRDVLLVMAECCHRGRDAFVPLWIISRELTRRGRSMPAQALIDTMRALNEAGFVQRIDGGNKQKADAEVDYVISENGLDHLRFSVC